MNSTISDEWTREHLASEAAKCLREIFTNTEKVNALQREIVEINVSISAYIEESRKNLEELRLDQAKNARSSYQVVQLLSDKYIDIIVMAETAEELSAMLDDLNRASVRVGLKMNMDKTKVMLNAHVVLTPIKFGSTVLEVVDENDTMSSPIPINNRIHRMTRTSHEDNNNKSKLTEQQQGRSFITWYKHMIDNDRNNLGLYLSDDAVLEWFGRMIKSKKKVTAFFKYDMQCTRHDFTTVESIEKVELRSDLLQRKEDLVLASSLNSPELRPSKRKLLQSCSSPEWAEGCKPLDEPDQKRSKTEKDVEIQCNGRKRLFSVEDIGKGDGGLERKSKRICIQDSTITPPNKEVGQGDCLPSTSGTDSDRSHDTLNAQLPKLAVECNGYIEFTRSRNSRNVDSMKWERKFKMQISYSEDPLNIGEYIIWMLKYTDETKCRRNLLAAFEEAAKEDKKI